MEWWWLLSLVLIGFFIPGCACCTCSMCEDNFNRANSTNISTGSSCGWTEVAGNWEIASNKLAIGSANAIATCNTTHTTPYIYIEADIVVTTANDLARLILDYVDSNNYLYAEWKFVTVGATTGTFSLIKRVAGVNTTLRQLDSGPRTGAATRCFACLNSGGHFSAYYGDGLAEAWLSADGLTPTTGTVGVGTGSAAMAVTFDDVLITKTDVAGCDPCAIYDCLACAQDTYPWDVQVVIGGTISTSACTPTPCSTFAATWVIPGRKNQQINVSPPPAYTYNCYYALTLTPAICGSGGNYNLMQFSFNLLGAGGVTRAEWAVHGTTYGQAKFTYDFASVRDDCSTLSGTAMTFSANGTMGCNFSLATVTATGLYV